MKIPKVAKTPNIEDIETAVPELLAQITKSMYEKALERRESMTHTAHNMEEMCDVAANRPGFIKAMWCGELDCEMQLKEEADVTSRCMPFDASPISDKCVCCGRAAKKLVYWGKAY